MAFMIDKEDKAIMFYESVLKNQEYQMMIGSKDYIADFHENTSEILRMAKEYKLSKNTKNILDIAKEKSTKCK